jgi:hypothetical protein
MSVYAFNNVSVIGISSQGSFLGESINRYRTVETISIEGFIDSRSSNTDMDGVKETQQTISTYITNASSSDTNVIQEITVNGSSLGNGKIISLNFEAAENTLNSQIIVGSFDAVIEIPKDSGSFSNAIDSGGTISPSKILEEISENFSVSLTSDGSYQFDHSLSVSLFLDAVNDDSLAEEAKGFANAIFRERQNSAITSFDLILGDHYGDYNSQARETFDESYDLLNGKFDFKQKFTLNKESGGEYSIVRTHSFAIGSDGIIRVVENGEILGNTSATENSVSWINTEIAGAYVRCVSIFGTYHDNFGGKSDIETTRGISISSPIGLNSRPISITKKIDLNVSSASYSATFSDDEGYINSNYYLDRNISISKPKGSVFSVIENGTLKYNEVKNRGFDPVTRISSIQGDEPLSKARCEEFLERAHNKSGSHHSSGSTHTINLTKSAFSFNKHGKSINYSFDYSDSPELARKHGNTVTGSSIKEQDENPSDKFTTYIIPAAGDEISHSPSGTAKSNLATRTVVVEYTLARVASRNIYETVYDISSALEFARQEAISEAFKAGVDNAVLSLDYNEIYITSASYSFSAERKLTVTVTAEYPTVAYGDINRKKPF